MIPIKTSVLVICSASMKFLRDDDLTKVRIGIHNDLHQRVQI
jgi:hypothetical protein